MIIIISKLFRIPGHSLRRVWVSVEKTISSKEFYFASGQLCNIELRSHKNIFVLYSTDCVPHSNGIEMMGVVSTVRLVNMALTTMPHSSTISSH